jgi:catechol 2,3-dioxygenase-like lactoylglutathione lyase family enzyme
MIFRDINGVVLLVQDLDRCMKFYRDTVGLEIVYSDDVSYIFKLDSRDFVLLEVNRAAEQISEAAVKPQQAGVNHMFLCADVDDVDAAYQALTAKGVAFIQPPTDQPWKMRTAYFADPEGNLWELRRNLMGTSQ